MHNEPTTPSTIWASHCPRLKRRLKYKNGRLTLVTTRGDPWSQPPAILIPHGLWVFLRFIVTVKVRRCESPMLLHTRTHLIITLSGTFHLWNVCYTRQPVMKTSCKIKPNLARRLRSHCQLLRVRSRWHNELLNHWAWM